MRPDYPQNEYTVVLLNKFTQDDLNPVLSLLDRMSIKLAGYGLCGLGIVLEFQRAKAAFDMMNFGITVDFPIQFNIVDRG
jgi:hypothetical protein